MPLKKGTSRKTVEKNIKELMKGQVSGVRRKAIETIKKRTGDTFRGARDKQAVAIARKEQERSAGHKGDKMLKKMAMKKVANKRK